MTLEELKIRQLTNQYLITPSDHITVARDLCGAQAQFMPYALHSLKIRCRDYDEETIKRDLVKNWTIRGTMHVFAKEDLPLFLHCKNGAEYRLDQWGGYRTWQRPDGTYSWYDDGGCQRVWSLTPERQKYFAALILDAVQDTPKTRDELKAICRTAEMSEIEEDSMFQAWGGGIAELCRRGFMHYVVEEKKAYLASPDVEPIPEEAAKLEIARRYFTNIAPATVRDAAYFLGISQKDVKKYLEKLPVTTAEADGKTYYYIENGKDYGAAIPPCIFLSGFDQLMLGYQKKESLYLAPEHLRGIFNLAGIVMPAVLLQGKVAGKWKKKNRKLTIEPFRRLTRRDKAAIEENALLLWQDTVSIECSV